MTGADKLAISSVKMPLQLAMVTLLGVFTATLEADIVYKSVDNDGNILYSDQPPNDDQLLIENIELPEYSQQTSQEGVLQNSTLEQITKTADRLKQDRLDREALKLQQQQLRQAYSPPQYNPTIIEENNYYPGSRRHFPRQHFRHFPSIYDRKNGFYDSKDPFRHKQMNDDLRDAGPVITPKSRLLTP